MTETVYSFIGKQFRNWQRHDGKFGVEIETETEIAYSPPQLSYWNWTEDGSLRNYGVEYITRSPLSPKDLDEALVEFDKIDQPFIDGSISSSVHVHYNVLNLSPITLANAITAYTILEPVLCKYAGPYRESNLFCLQLRDAEAGVEHIQDLFDVLATGNTYSALRRNHDRMKYAALNIGSFWRQGSIEFRQMRGVTDIKIIRQWCEIVHCLFEYGATKADPYDVLNDFQTRPIGMLSLIFKDLAPLLEYEGWEKDTDMNLWLGWRLAISVKDWSQFGTKQSVKISRSEYNKKVAVRAESYGRTEPNEGDRQMVLIEMVITAGGDNYEDFEWIEDENTSDSLDTPDLQDGPQPTVEMPRWEEGLFDHVEPRDIFLDNDFPATVRTRR